MEPVKESYPTLSTAERIELVGQVALDDTGNVAIDFMGGRTDANNENGTEILPGPARVLQHDTDLRARQHQDSGCVSYKAEGKNVYMMDMDLVLLAAPELKEAVQLLA
ncbi:catalase/peroxidase HPI [Phytophthora cinnamomi]|uniref:catalase/peroxidase HPI n=1 Tax=Phytophthora cinnamomi TaxID=4785 RepID=UPI00355A0B68|nr:catalase/peroxidase HPI [Phytophthora cinnamomi]